MRSLVGAILVISLAVNGLVGYVLWHRQPAQLVQVTGGPVVMRTQGGLLEVSTITSQERFETTKNHTILGVPFGTTISMIQVPAVFRYHIPLAREWTFRVEGGTLVVMAPPVRPSLPVAVDLAKLQAFSSGVWAPLTAQSQQAALQKSMTTALEKRAGSSEMLQLQREVARKTVTEFVQKWVVEQSKWKEGKSPVVLVFFEDEPLGSQIAPLLRATQ
jgi:hypothetical protein